jgi:Mrp family chromosome partitioning ATPase
LSAQYVLRAIQRRWRLVAAIVLLTCVAVGIFVFGRKHSTEPVRYRSVASVRIAPKVKVDKSGSSNKKSASSTTAAPNIVLSGPQRFALRKTLITTTLARAHLAANSGIKFTAQLSSAEDVLALSVTAPTRVVAQKVARLWAAEFGKERRADAVAKLTASNRQLERRVGQLHDELRIVDAQLVKLMPIVYGGILRYNAPNGNQFTDGVTGPPPVPEQGSTHGLNLANERVQLLASLAEQGAKAANIRISHLTVGSVAAVVSQTPAARVSQSRATTIPALGGLLGGILFAFGAALLVDRADRTIHDPEEAALTFSAPVLSIIPADGEDFAVIAEPNSLAAEAYRGLAAMAIATDRLPKAIMVSTPTGDAHAQVAANFAAALSRLGLKVALMATSADQDWYLDAFTSPNGMMRLPELLDRAQSGTLGPSLPQMLPATDRAPNLVVVPPADEPMLHLPIDGLPALLQALSDGGVDVTVISGPPLLEEADATIVAWATRNVLWAIIPGEVTRAEARAAAARMELAGVTPFGVVMVEPQTLGV